LTTSHPALKVGAVDCTTMYNLASKYGIRSYPTIKLFPLGRSGKRFPLDYKGKRDARSIVTYAKETLNEASPSAHLDNSNPHPFQTDEIDFHQHAHPHAAAPAADHATTGHIDFGAHDWIVELHNAAAHGDMEILHMIVEKVIPSLGEPGLIKAQDENGYCDLFAVFIAISSILYACTLEFF
jgi:hypothetical protein